MTKTRLQAVLALFLSAACYQQAWAHLPASGAASTLDGLVHQLLSWHHLPGVVLLGLVATVAVLLLGSKRRHERVRWRDRDQD